MPHGAGGVGAARDSHKEEAGADVVRDGADPDVAVFLQVLGGDDCWGKGLSLGGRRSLLGARDPPSLLQPPTEPGKQGLPHSLPPLSPPAPRTFTKCDAVQVAALEEAGLDGAGLQGEQPVLARPGSAHTHRCCVPIPTLPGCPLARHLGDGVHPVVPLHQLVLRRHPVLPFPHPCGEARRRPSPLGRQHPWVTQGHMPQTRTATPHAPALRPNPGNPPDCAQQLSELRKHQGFTSLTGKRPAQAGRTQDATRSRMAPPTGVMPNLPGPMQGAGTGAQAGPGGAGSPLPEYPKEILEMGLR